MYLIKLVFLILNSEYHFVSDSSVLVLDKYCSKTYVNLLLISYHLSLLNRFAIAITWTNFEYSEHDKKQDRSFWLLQRLLDNHSKLIYKKTHIHGHNEAYLVHFVHIKLTFQIIIKRRNEDGLMTF